MLLFFFCGRCVSLFCFFNVLRSFFFVFCQIGFLGMCISHCNKAIILIPDLITPNDKPFLLFNDDHINMFGGPCRKGFSPVEDTFRSFLGS